MNRRREHETADTRADRGFDYSRAHAGFIRQERGRDIKETFNPMKCGIEAGRVLQIADNNLRGPSVSDLLGLFRLANQPAHMRVASTGTTRPGNLPAAPNARIIICPPEAVSTAYRYRQVC